MKLNVLYIISKSKLNKKGECPVKCRITLNKKRKHFATGVMIKPKNWNSKQQVIEPSEPDAELKNTQLSLIKTKLSQAFCKSLPLYIFLCQLKVYCQKPILVIRYLI